jgi:hypothetical protein
MSSERIEFESEAWYRAVAEGRLGAGSDRKDGQVRPPDPRGAAAVIRPISS